MKTSYIEKLRIHKDNKIAALYPSAKLAVVLSYAVCTFIIDSIPVTRHELSLWLIPWFAVIALLCAASGILKKATKAFGAILIIAGIIFAVQTFLVRGEDLVWQFGFIHIYERGLRKGISLAFMILNVAGVFVWFFQTTTNKEIACAMEESGINYKAAYVFTSTLQMISTLKKSSRTIMDAQRARGIETEGNMLIRAKAFC